MAAIDIQNLWKQYGDFTAVKDLNLKIDEGEIFGLLGPNGAGKSSTIHLIAGLCRMQKGSIKIFGKDIVTDFVETRRNVGLMHQEIVIDNFLPIGKMLNLHPGYYGVKIDPDWRDLLIERLALEPHLGKKMMGLSGGMKRRFMVAKALIHKPKLLILDEPTAGVDVELRVALWDFVREINKRGTTILLTTHYIEEAEELCGRIGIMHHGELVALDKTKSLVQKINKRHLTVSFKTGDDLKITLNEGDSLQKVINDLANPGSKDGRESDNKNYSEVVDFDLQKGSLEDAFLSLTRTEGGRRE